ADPRRGGRPAPRGRRQAGAIHRLDHSGPAGPAGVGSLAEGAGSAAARRLGRLRPGPEAGRREPPPAPRSPIAEGRGPRRAHLRHLATALGRPRAPAQRTGARLAGCLRAAPRIWTLLGPLRGFEVPEPVYVRARRKRVAPIPAKTM